MEIIHSTDNQFVFKSKQGSGFCLFALKGIVNKHRSLLSSVLNRKAFDCVSREGKSDARIAYGNSGSLVSKHAGQKGAMVFQVRKLSNNFLCMSEKVKYRGPLTCRVF